MDTIYNANGCFYRALDDEPVFVLLARDPCTPEAIRHWVTLRQALIGRGEKPLEDHETLGDAISTATQAGIWRSEATDPGKWGPNGKRWHEEEVATKELVETGTLDELRSRVLTDANQFLQYAASHFAKDSEESWRKGEVNWSHYLECCRVLGINPADKPTGGSKTAASVLASSRAGASADGSTSGGTMLPYDEWQRVLTHPETMRLGNRFLLGFIGVDFVFWENRNYATPEEVREDWTGYYPLRHSLQRDMLLLAYKDWRDAVVHKVETLQRLLPSPQDLTRLVDLPPEEGRPDAILRKRLEAYTDDMRVTLSAGILRKVLRATPFVAVDLAAKMATGVRQVTGDMKDWLGDRQGYERAKSFLAFVDRLNGYAAELEEGSMIGKTLQSRPRSSRPFGIPDFEPPMTPAQAIETIGSATGTVFDGEAMRPKADSDMVDVTELADMPPHRFAMFTKSKGWAYGRGLEINPSHIPDMLDRMELDGYTLVAALGAQADKVGMIFQRGQRYTGLEIAHGFGQRLPDAPESPEMQAWRRGDPLPTGSDAIELDCGGPGQEPCGPAGMGRGLEP